MSNAQNMTVNTSELQAAMKASIERNGYRYNEVADSMRVSPQRLSNVLNGKDSITAQFITKFLQTVPDARLALFAAVYLVPTLGFVFNPFRGREEADVRKRAADREEEERKALDQQAEDIMGIDASQWLPEEYEFMVGYQSEFKEEVGCEQMTIIDIDEDIRRYEMSHTYKEVS